MAVFVPTLGEADLTDLGYTAAVRRTHLDYRTALVAETGGALRDQLIQSAQEDTAERTPVSEIKPRQIAFVFPGQGSQWLGMGRQLLAQEPVFREAMHACEKVLSAFVSWSLLDELSAPAERSRFEEIDFIQPALFAMQVSLAALWRSWGIEPRAVIGHSMGEVASAYVAGALSLDEAAHIITRRSQLMKQVSGNGAMAAVDLTYEAAQKLLADYENKLSIAVSNGPRSTVISGDPAALAEVMAHLQAQNVFCRPVKVDVAAHSPQMEALRPALVAGLAGLQPHAGAIDFYSTVRAGKLDGELLDSDYWGENLRRPVLFSATLQKALENGLNTFIEISPHPVLLQAIVQGFQQCGQERSQLLALPSLKRGDDDQAALFQALGRLFEFGLVNDWTNLYPRDAPCLTLPAYPWQMERYWYTSPASPKGHSSGRKKTAPFLGNCVRSGASAMWEVEIAKNDFPYLEDHRVNGAAILPAAAFCEIAMEAAAETCASPVNQIEDLEFVEALSVPDQETPAIRLEMTQTQPGYYRFTIHSGSFTDPSTWVRHCTGRLGPSGQVSEPRALPEALTLRGAEVISGEEHARVMAARQLPYGPAFQRIQQIWREGNRVLGELSALSESSAPPARYQLHPTLLDACFQLLLATAVEDESQALADTFIPIRLKELRVATLPAPQNSLFGYAIRCGEGEDLEGDVFLLDETGQVLVSAQGLQMRRIAHPTSAGMEQWTYSVEWQALPADAPSAQADHLAGTWLTITEGDDFGRQLSAGLAEKSRSCILAGLINRDQVADVERLWIDPSSPEGFRKALADIATRELAPLEGVLFAWGISPAQAPGLDFGRLSLGAIALLHLAQAMVQQSGQPRLWIVTRGAQRVGPQDGAPALEPAPLWGLARVIANEQPELKCTIVDLGSQPDDQETQNLLGFLLASCPEGQLSLRHAGSFIPRLVPMKLDMDAAQAQPAAADEVLNEGQPYKVTTHAPGILDQLVVEPMPRVIPKAGEVEIEIHAVGLNFLNVLSAMGKYPGYEEGFASLGIECAGQISAVGEGVCEFQVGDRVVSVARDCLASHVTVDARLVAPAPEQLSFKEAATIPIAFLTAYYGLVHQGRMQRGERVLVHSASGGVGLAALQLARQAGLEIFATAGTPEKRAYLESLGIEGAMDSRALSFPQQILARTDHEGLDLVLNSLSGEAIQAGLSVLRPYGRFVEIGKRDIYQNSSLGLQPFQKNLSFFAVDLDKMMRERTDFVGRMLRQVMQMAVQGEIQPLPVCVYPLAKTADAFRSMAQARHTGKLVIATCDRAGARIQRPAPVAAGAIIADATYLITGGLGGLGLTTAEWLAEQGARRLVLVGRKGPAARALQQIHRLEQMGVEVVTAQVDVTSEFELRGLFARMARELPPVHGIFHAAGFLDDGMLNSQTAEKFLGVMRPKVQGAWILHELSKTLSLDFFVLFSSVAGTLGLAGQANYAAANVFLDALAETRRAQGLPALSIAWGPWAKVGLAAGRADRGARLARSGVASISPDQGKTLLSRLILQPAAQILVMPFDVDLWRGHTPTAGEHSLFASLESGSGQSGTPEETAARPVGILAALRSEPAGKPRRALLEAELREQAAQVLRIPKSKIPPHKPLKNFGLDSLMALEFSNRLEARFELKVPVSTVWNYPTIQDLAEFLASGLGISLTEEAQAAPVSSVDGQAEGGPVTAPSEMDDLSTADLEKLLAEEIAQANQLLRGGEGE